MVNGPPRAKEFTSAFRERARAPKRITITTNVQEKPIEPLSIRQQIIRSAKERFGEKLGGRIGQAQATIFFIQKEIERLEKTPGNQKKIKDLKLQIAEARRSIRDELKVQGGKVPTGPGITTTITRKSGRIIELTPSPEGQITTITDPETSTETIFEPGKKPVTTELFTRAPSTQTPTPFTIQGERVVGGRTDVKTKGPVFITETGKEFAGVQSIQPAPVTTQPLQSIDPTGTISIEQASKIIGSPLEQTGFIERSSAIPKPITIRQKQKAEEGIFTNLSKATDELSISASEFLGRGLIPKKLIESDERGIRFVPISEKERQKRQLGLQQTVQLGQFFIPVFGEGKAIVDIGSEFEQGRGEGALFDIASGVALFGGLKVVGKGFVKTSEIVGKIESPVLKNIVGKTTKVAQKGVEFGLPITLTAPAVVSVSQKSSRLESGESFQNLSREITRESKASSGVIVGFGLGRIGSNLAKEARLIATGKKFLEPEVFIDPQVLKGEETFPFVRGGIKKQVASFQRNVGPFKGPGGFSATRFDLRGRFVVKSETSETPGLFIAPVGSPFFLRLQNRVGRIFETRSPSFFPDLLVEGGTPRFFRTEGPVGRIPKRVLREFEKIPGILRKPAFGPGVSPQQIRANRLFDELVETQPGKAFFSPGAELGKPETEAIFPQRNIFEQVRFRFFTRVQGEPIEIIETRATGEFIPSVASKKISSGPKRVKRVRVNERSLVEERPFRPLSVTSGRRSASLEENTIARNVLRSSIVRRGIVSRSSPDELVDIPEIDESVTITRPRERFIFEDSSLRKFDRLIEPRRPRRPTREIISTDGTENFILRRGGISTGRTIRPPEPPRIIRITRKITPERTPDFLKKTESFFKRNKRKENRLPKTGPSFGVITRIRGKEVLLPQRLTRKEALSFGANIVDKTLRASFKIIPTGGIATEKGIFPQVNIKSFRRGRKGFFVEPRSRRLSTRSEVRNIQSLRKASSFKVPKVSDIL